MAARLQLTLVSDRPPEQVAELTRSIAADLRRSPDVDVRPATRPAAPGERSGDVALLGQLALTFLTGGAASALIACLNSYLTRDNTLVVKVEAADGRKLEIDAKRLRARDLPQVVEALRRFSSGAS